MQATIQLAISGFVQYREFRHCPVYDEYALPAFDAQAIDCLLKPA